MPVTFNVRCTYDGQTGFDILHFEDQLGRLLNDPDLKARLDDHHNRIKRERSLSVLSYVKKWSETRNEGVSWKPERSGYSYPIPEIPLSDEFEQLINDVGFKGITTFEAPTGSGKSVVIPAVLHQFFEREIRSERLSSTTRFRVLHLVPTSEQCTQNVEFLQNRLNDIMNVGCYSSGFNAEGRERQILNEKTTNYLYVTQFFALAPLSGNDHFHAIVVDEIHEVTPTVGYVLYLIREKMKKKQINRVILLSATLQSWLKEFLISYFGRENIQFVSRGRPPHHIELRSLCSTPVSVEALAESDGSSLLDTTFYSNEETNGKPHSDRIFLRTVHLALCLVKQKMREVGFNPDNLDAKGSGIICFLPGKTDVMFAIRDFIDKFVEFTDANTSEEDAKQWKYQIKAYPVHGANRIDLKFLSDQPLFREIRVIFSTPLLESGVTLLGIDYVIDGGLKKIPGPSNLRNINCLVAQWEDGASRMQRRGRVGRIRDGVFHEVYSQQRSGEIQSTDHSKSTLISLFRTSDLVPPLNFRQDHFITFDRRVYSELLLKSGLTGFLKCDASDQYTRGPEIDEIGVALFKALPGISLELGNFLLLCKSYGCLLSGMIFVAAIESNHSTLKHPSSGQNRFSRNNPHSVINSWSSRIRGDVSDIIVYVDILINVWVSKVGSIHRETEEWAYNINVPTEALSSNAVNDDGLKDMNRSYAALVAGLKALRLFKSREDLSHIGNSGLQLEERGQWKVLQLREDRRRGFNIALVSAFGTKILSRASPLDQMRASHRTMFKLDIESQPGADRVQLVQGDRKINTPHNMVAVYYDLFMRGDEEFITGWIHQCTPLDFLVHGNSYGAINDEVKMNECALIIHTTTGATKFIFDDVRTLKLISEYRRVMRSFNSVGSLCPTMPLWTKMHSLAQFEFNLFITVIQHPSNIPVPSIDRWQQLSGVGLNL